MRHIYKTLGFMLSIQVLVSSCTTFGRKGRPEDVDKDSPAQAVVGQASRKGAVVSAQNRQYWLGLRQSKKTLPRIYGALATGEADIAVDLARKYLVKHPGDTQGLMLLAAGLALDRKYDLADYYAGLVEKNDPNNAVALNIRGVAVMLKPKNKMSDFRRAAGFFQRAIDADTTQIAAGMNLGSLQLELGDAASALATFDEVSKRCGSCNEALMGYGIAAARRQSFEDAKGAFEKILAKNPYHPGALYQLALVQKNGFRNRKKAEKYLFTLLNDSRSQADRALKERAHSVLRAMKGEKDLDERSQGVVAGSDDKQSGGDKDADALMSSEEMGPE